MSELRDTTQRYFLIAVSIILGLLALRFLLVLFGVSTTFPGGNILLSLTDPLVVSFVGIWPNWVIGSLVWSWSVVLAIVFWSVVSLVILDFILTFLDDDPARIFVNLIDALLKVFQFLVLSRFILMLFSAPGGSVFVDTIYGLTGWSRLGLGEFNILGGRVEIGSLISFVLLVFMDIFWESFADKYVVKAKIFKKLVKEKKTVTTKTVETKTTPTVTVVMPQVQSKPSVTVLSKEQFEELKKEVNASNNAENK